MSRSRRSLAERLYRLLVRILPPELRRDYGEDIVELFLDRRREPGSRARLWMAAIGDLVTVAVAERWNRSKPFPARIHVRRARQKGWLSMMDFLQQDARFAMRTWSRSPGFAALAILTFALAVGANTAIFGILNGVVFEPLPFGDPEDLVAVWETSELERIPKSETSAGSFLDWRDKNQTLFDLTASTFDTVVLEDQEHTASMNAALVYPNFFSVLNLDPLFGRGFVMEDAPPGERGKVIIVSHALWRDRFGADPTILSRTLRVDGEPHDVVAVMRPDVAAPDANTDIWIPVAFQSPMRRERHRRRLGVVGRLKPGVSLAQAQQDFSRIAAELGAGEYSDIYLGWDALVVPLQEEIVGESRPTLATALAAVGLVLVIACVNIGNMLLARTAGRQREIAVRTAMGAGRARLVGQLLIESMVLAAAGGAVGLAVAFGLHELLLRFQPGVIPRVEELGLDLEAFGFAAVVTGVAGFFFGLVPALQSSRVEVQSALQQGGARGATEGRAMSRARGLMVSAQLALATLLLCGAGLLLRTMWELGSVDPGFRTDDRYAMSVFLDTRRYDSAEKIREYFARLTDRLAALPEVRAVGASSALPMDPLGINYDLPYRLEGQLEVPSNEAPQADFRVVTPGYFEALGVQLRAGRSFDRFERPETTFVAMVNEAMARQVWPNGNAVGQRFETPSTHWFEVVGVVSDTRYYGPRNEPRPEIYVAHAQVPRANMTLVVETKASATALDRLRREVLEQDPAQPMHSLTTMASLVSDTTAAERFYTIVLGAFAALALILSAAGVFGVLSYWVVARTQEIGVRMALGASRTDVLRSVLARGLGLGLAGVLVGLTAALISSRVVESLLFGVTATDPMTFVAVALLLLATALAACSTPALRASRVDPILALRDE